jgi:hypothetical protein
MMQVRLAGAVLAIGLVVTPPGRAELKGGSRLDATTWEEAKDLLAPEILAHYKEGKFASPVGEIPKGEYALDERFFKASQANEGKFKLDEHGSVVEAATGKPPEYSFGAPFPKLDPNDPQVATRIMWNYEYAYWSNGNNRVQAFLMWLDEKSRSPERAIALDSRAKVYEGNPVREPNPQQFSRLDKNFLVEPADLHGSASLTWRYKDPTKRDQLWAFVPALRRVRAVSPANRSDGVFGSEMTQDDGFNGFDAKPEEFKYKLVAVKDEYHTFSPDALEGKIKFIPHPAGRGWVFDTPTSRYGFREADWKGLPWASLDNTLVKRPVWMIEAVPNDRYYLYGKLVFGIDRETYKICNVIKYDWKGQAMAVFNRGIAYGRAPDGYRYVNITGGGRGGAYAENMRMRRATAADPSVPGTRVELDMDQNADAFQLENLAREGK